jgi:hypothetical protein
VILLAVAVTCVAVTLAFLAVHQFTHKRQHASASIVSRPATGGISGETRRKGGWTTLVDPIQPRQLTDLAFCDRSFWLQPWRAYLDTPLASTFANAMSVNLNVAPPQVSRTTRLLAGHGIRRVRIELPWSLMSYQDPTKLLRPPAILTVLRQLKAAGVRPLILLNANQGLPGPAKAFTLHVVASAAAGARTIMLGQRSAANVVPGLTGLDTPETAAGDLITSVTASGSAQLSRPLPQGLRSGPAAATTLRYAPFAPPVSSQGRSNPPFQATIDGWLSYVSAITHVAARVFGPTGFDVEIWNELSFGSAFLDNANYYVPVPPNLSGSGSVDNALLRATVIWIRDPDHGVSHIGIGDGFANQTPFASPLTAPPGLTALDKHPYPGARRVFGPRTGPLPCQPLDALGQTDGARVGPTAFRDRFTPSFVDYFPEYYLNALQTETVVRDLAPITTRVAGVAHGALGHRRGSAPPQLWITEVGIDERQVNLSSSAARHMQAKAALRYLVSFIGAGATLVDLYTAAGDDFGLIDPAFFTSSGGEAPISGGATIDTISRLARAVQSSARVIERRSLMLRSLASRSHAVQFTGDGTARHPSLTDLDATAVFPFQAANHRFVVAAYVMTRNIARVYAPSAPNSDLARYDLPAETDRITLGGVDGKKATATATDPLYGISVPVQVVARTASTVTLQIPLTDSPRLITLRD